MTPQLQISEIKPGPVLETTKASKIEKLWNGVNKIQPINHDHHQRFRRKPIHRRKKKQKSKRQKLNGQRLNKLKLSNPGNFFLIHIKRTKNNTVSSLSNLFGHQRTLWTIRGGQISPGGPKGRRKTRYTQRLLFKSVVKKLFGFGAKHLVIQVKGFSASKRYIFKHFMKRFKIVMFKDITGIAHNGCRAPKARRV